MNGKAGRHRLFSQTVNGSEDALEVVARDRNLDQLKSGSASILIGWVCSPVGDHPEASSGGSAVRNPHLHFHCVVIGGVFDAIAAGAVILHVATGLDVHAIAAVETQARQRMLRLFERRGLLPAEDARAMAQWDHGGGFSIDASVCIVPADRAGRERPLRYCARLPFALEWLREVDG